MILSHFCDPKFYSASCISRDMSLCYRSRSIAHSQPTRSCDTKRNVRVNAAARFATRHAPRFSPIAPSNATSFSTSVERAALYRPGLKINDSRTKINTFSIRKQNKERPLKVSAVSVDTEPELQDCNFTSDYDSEFGKFKKLAQKGNIVPLHFEIFSDHLTPVIAYNAIAEKNSDTLSFLFESVEGGNAAGRYSFLGANPAKVVIAKEEEVYVLDQVKMTTEKFSEMDPMKVPERISKSFRPILTNGLPPAFCGGWVGYAGYDTARYAERRRIPFASAPLDDRSLADVHFSLYNDVVIFDHVSKVVYVICWVHVEEFDSLESAYADGCNSIDNLKSKLQDQQNNAASKLKKINLQVKNYGERLENSNMKKSEFMDAVNKAKEYILSGDIFQIVLSQRFERKTFSKPFEIYRSLRIVNPSPYMIYMQAHGVILVASSPEILCRITSERKVINRPLAGTRKRGHNIKEDMDLEASLLSDEKEKAEHVMLVDLGRNDVGKVSKDGTVKVERFLDIERYSHVMHISSTVTGELKEELSCWDALRAALPVGTVSGAPKVRAMELIDLLEPTRRGVYGGGMGYVSFNGDMDIALALRTMVVPTNIKFDSMFARYEDENRREWTVHLQAGAGIVADSDPLKEFEETVNKSAALARAIDLAENVFLS